MSAVGNSKPDLTSLIERIEAATEGSRELDVLVGAAIDLRVDEGHLSFRNSFEICGMEQMLRMAESHQNIWREALPRYSTSIDAALTLLPEGWWWSAGVCRRENHASVGSEIGTVEGELIFEMFGSTAPLALLAAILRARQTEGQG